MKRYILLSFAFLGAGFYELSGGSDFDPGLARAEAIAMRQAREAARIARLPEAQREIVAARSDATPATARTDAPTEAQDTQLALNLATYSAVTGAETRAERPAAPADPPAARPAEPQPTLSLDSLDRPSLPASGAAIFEGSTLTATSVAPEEIPASGTERAIDIRTVKGTLVNMRSGPGTDYDVVDQLPQATRVEILSDTGNGWVELRPVDGGPTGWIAAFLLTDG